MNVAISSSFLFLLQFSDDEAPRKAAAVPHRQPVTCDLYQKKNIRTCVSSEVVSGRRRRTRVRRQRWSRSHNDPQLRCETAGAAGAAGATLRATTLRPPVHSSCALWRALPAVMSGHSSAWPPLTGQQAMHEVLLTCQSSGHYSRLILLCHMLGFVCACEAVCVLGIPSRDAQTKRSVYSVIVNPINLLTDIIYF